MTEDFETWEQTLILPDSRKELKKIQKNLRRRNRKTILSSVLLVALLFLCAVYIFIPAAQMLYWDPTVCSYLDTVTDLELTMVTYNSLFGHGQHMMPPAITKTGFADYSIDTHFVKWETVDRMTMISRRSAAITKGTFHADPNFWMEIMEGSFIRLHSDEDLHISLTNEKSQEILTALPEYIQVLASVSFPKDLSMKQLQLLEEEYYGQDARFLWGVLRSSDPAEYVQACGIQLTDYAPERYQTDFWKDTAYPNLFPKRYSWSAKSMEQHVTSALRFSADQVRKGTGILPPGAEAGYYEDALEYMEANGIKTYGCYILATPAVLLDMMQTGRVSYIYLIDARIGL